MSIVSFKHKFLNVFYISVFKHEKLQSILRAKLHTTVQPMCDAAALRRFALSLLCDAEGVPPLIMWRSIKQPTSTPEKHKPYCTDNKTENFQAPPPINKSHD
jgi:hypothetical protein